MMPLRRLVLPSARSFLPAATGSSSSSTSTAPHLARRSRSYSSSSSNPPSNPSSPADGSSSSSSNNSRPVTAFRRSGNSSSNSSVTVTNATARRGAQAPASAQRLPFVPSTDHLYPADIAISTFFALHRPLSISTPLPTPVTVDNIFSPPPKKPAMRADVGSWEHGVPFSAPSPAGVIPEEAFEELEEGEKKPPNTMHAISVKRQRRLKMKKHKYKKLMRRTRNLRRRIERQSK